MSTFFQNLLSVTLAPDGPHQYCTIQKEWACIRCSSAGFGINSDTVPWVFGVKWIPLDTPLVLVIARVERTNRPARNISLQTIEDQQMSSAPNPWIRALPVVARSHIAMLAWPHGARSSSSYSNYRTIIEVISSYYYIIIKSYHRPWPSLHDVSLTGGSRSGAEGQEAHSAIK
jgi:hypothetical protein